MRIRWFLVALLLAGATLAPAAAAAAGWGEPERIGLAAYGGMGYDPGNRVRFGLISLSVLYDYDAIWLHRAPEPLRFKVEASLGNGGNGGADRIVAGAGVMALYYLERLATPSFRPYGEAGVGLIYTDFQVPEQGLRINFNPRFGLGCEFGGHSRPWYAAVHAHHISNGGLNDDNRGINSLLLQFGRTF
jgi:hypothetical protein